VIEAFELFSFTSVPCQSNVASVIRELFRILSAIIKMLLLIMFVLCDSLAPLSLFLLQLVTDVNLAVAVEATQAIGNLAKGLRTHFSGNSRNLLPVLLVS
jgi:hypothetical protein